LFGTLVLESLTGQGEAKVLVLIFNTYMIRFAQEDLLAFFTYEQFLGCELWAAS